MSKIKITPNANGLTNMEDLTLAELKVIQIALSQYYKNTYMNRENMESLQRSKHLLLEVETYFASAAKRISEKQLIN